MERNESEMNATYKYSLDKSSKKFPCPSCGKTRFVRYIDNSANTYLPDNYGRCDREINCGYHIKPGTDLNNSHNMKYFSSPPDIKEPDFIPYNICQDSLSNYKQNNFIQFLKTIFSREIITSLISNFFIGTSDYWPGATIFWQIDKKGNIHSGKIMLYDSVSGKRTKEPFSHIQWIHKTTSIKNDFTLKQCLFGEHQLNNSPDDKLIAVVESEKTAIIMSGFYPDYIWLATGSLSNINPDLFSPIKDRNITLYPDLNGFAKWKDKAALLIDHGYKVIVSDLLEKKSSGLKKEEGYDIADFFISSAVGHPELSTELAEVVEGGHPVLVEGPPLKPVRLLTEGVSKAESIIETIPLQNKLALTKDDIIFNQMLNKNPFLLDFVIELDLLNSKTNQPFTRN